MHSAFYGEDPVGIKSCAYLHNLQQVNANALSIRSSHRPSQTILSS